MNRFIVLIFNELQRQSEISTEQSHFFRRKVDDFATIFCFHFFFSVNLGAFERMFKNFLPIKGYDSRCLKIVNIILNI